MAKRKSKPIKPPEPPALRTLEDTIQLAKESDRYMMAIFWVDGETIHLERHCHNFNVADFDPCIGLLHTDLQKEANGGT